MISNGNIYFKHLPVKKVIKLLQALPDDTVVHPNEIGNLAIYKKDGDSFEMLSIVDFSDDGEIKRI